MTISPLTLQGGDPPLKPDEWVLRVVVGVGHAKGGFDQFTGAASFRDMPQVASCAPLASKSRWRVSGPPPDLRGKCHQRPAARCWRAGRLAGGGPPGAPAREGPSALLRCRA